MTLMKCDECGGDVSSEAKACPKCGAKPRQSGGIWIVLFLSFIGYLVYTLFSTPATPPRTPPSPEEIALKQREEATFQKVAIMAASIKKNLREPESVKWEIILSDDDANVMCFGYRARNGFGGMTNEHITVAKGKASRDASAWNKYCANKPLNDMIHVRQALR